MAALWPTCVGTSNTSSTSCMPHQGQASTAPSATRRVCLAPLCAPELQGSVLTPISPAQVQLREKLLNACHEQAALCQHLVQLEGTALHTRLAAARHLRILTRYVGAGGVPRVLGCGTETPKCLLQLEEESVAQGQGGAKGAGGAQ